MFPTSLPMPSVQFGAIKKVSTPAPVVRPDKLDTKLAALKELREALSNGDINPGENHILTGYGTGDVNFTVVDKSSISVKVKDIMGRDANVTFSPYSGLVLDATRSVGGDEGAVEQLNKLFASK